MHGAIEPAQEQMHRANNPKNPTDATSQPRPSDSKALSSDNQRREEAGNAQPQENPEFIKHWKAVKFTRNEIGELLKVDPVGFPSIHLNLATDRFAPDA